MVSEQDSLLPSRPPAGPPGGLTRRRVLPLATATLAATAGLAALAATAKPGPAPAPDLAAAAVAAVETANETTWNATTKPHIAFVFVDDWGFNDVGYQSTDMQSCTPHMDALATSGVILSSYYSQSLCTPARAALMTAKYPIHLGMQHLVVESSSAWGLGLDETLLPEFLNDLGYKSYMVGKWHLGHFHTDYLPTSRGFEAGFTGFYGNSISYFSHVSELGECVNPDCFLDLRSNDDPLQGQDGLHSTYLLAQAADAQVSAHVAAHGTDTPMFLYYATANVHNPVEVPREVLNGEDGEVSGGAASCVAGIPNHARREYAALTWMLDQAVHNLTSSLQRSGLWDSTVLVVASDNGADPLAENDLVAGNAGSNFPLRGLKGYLFEGGVRVPAFVHSSLLPAASQGTTFSGLFHVTDWLPTLVGGVLGHSELVHPSLGYDGLDQWEALLGERTSKRTHVLLNIDDIGADGCEQDFSTMAIRYADLKLIANEVDLPVWEVPRTNNNPDELFIDWASPQNWYLFNLTADPSETTNLIEDRATDVEWLSNKLSALLEGVVATRWCPTIAEATDVFEQTGFVGPFTNQSDVSCNAGCERR